jgi:hypothetical protein
MPASSSIHAPAAARYSSRNPATVACSVPTARFLARRSRPSVRARRAPLATAADSYHDKQYRSKRIRLAAKPANEPARQGDPLDRLFALFERLLDYCTELDSNGMHSQCAAVRTRTLPLHRQHGLGPDPPPELFVQSLMVSLPNHDRMRRADRFPLALGKAREAEQLAFLEALFPSGADPETVWQLFRDLH